MKHIFVLCFLSSWAFSTIKNYELTLYEKVLPTLFNSKHLKVYSDVEAKIVLQKSFFIQVIDDCSKAHLLIGKSFKNLPLVCLSKPIFATSYRSFKKNKNAFGAFYWRKGRPQIRFKNYKIEEFNLFLPPSFQKYTQ